MAASTLSTEQALQRAIAHHQAGQLPEAEHLYRTVLRAQAGQANANRNLGAVALYMLGIVAYQQGRLDEAIARYEQALAIKPDFVDVLSNLGVALKDRGRVDEAIARYEQAIALQPDFADALYNLANALRDRGRLGEAIARYEQALAARPDYASALSNLGAVLHEQGRLDEAVARYGQALAARPDFADALSNLGNALRDLGRLDEAIARYEQALAVEPGFASALSNLGVALYDQGRLDEAVARYEQALAVRPDYASALSNLGNALKDQGRLREAMDAAVRALRSDESVTSRDLFCECLKLADIESFDAGEIDIVHDLALRALAECWTRPVDLALPCLALARRNHAIRDLIAESARTWPARLPGLAGSNVWNLLASNRLLVQLLTSAVTPDLAFERFLANLRCGVLEIASTTSTADSGSALESACALAQQCFINEFVFAADPGELQRAAAMREALSAALRNGAGVPALQLACVATYFPLHTLPDAGRLLQLDWPVPVRELLRLQVGEPAAEAQLQTAMPRLTPVNDIVSAEVRGQYEENPYPRWIRSPSQKAFNSVDALLHRQCPLASFLNQGTGGDIDILIAGCGTGQHPIQTARQFPRARVLAIDLSLASLAYAQRKTRELGLANVEYAQADILETGSLGRTFDVIESVGVLHHLADPAKGLQALAGLLRPAGFMRLGLYSALARESVVAARAFIAGKGYGQGTEGIRECRQAMLDGGAEAPWGAVLASPDFFSTSGCRDLLFHVQEHRMTLPQIGSLLLENDLALIGFQVDAETARAYRKMFPADRAMNDLAQWDRFETAHPATFAGMYQFWVQKAARVP
jgi:tetratricopeptide (TPR) repeat protein/SAM-dependent methyltransferase